MRKSEIPIKERRKLYHLRHLGKHGYRVIKEQKARSRRFYVKNKKIISASFKNRYHSDPEFREKKRLGILKFRNLWKRKSFLLLGSKCTKCGFLDERALQIDHIKGDGHRDKDVRSNTWGYYKTVYDSVVMLENKYQLLCANCNWIKRIENNETGHNKV